MPGRDVAPAYALPVGRLAEDSPDDVSFFETDVLNTITDGLIGPATVISRRNVPRFGKFDFIKRQHSDFLLGQVFAARHGRA